MKFATLLTPSRVYLSRAPFSNIPQWAHWSKRKWNIIDTMVMYGETFYQCKTDLQKHINKMNVSRQKCSSDFPSNQSFSAHAQSLRKAAYLVLWLKFSRGPLLTCANSTGSGETARMRRLARTFAVRVCYSSVFSHDVAQIPVKCFWRIKFRKRVQRVHPYPNKNPKWLHAHYVVINLTGYKDF